VTVNESGFHGFGGREQCLLIIIKKNNAVSKTYKSRYRFSTEQPTIFISQILGNMRKLWNNSATVKNIKPGR
jgi:hypothetical protein